MMRNKSTGQLFTVMLLVTETTPRTSRVTFETSDFSASELASPETVVAPDVPIGGLPYPGVRAPPISPRMSQICKSGGDEPVVTRIIGRGNGPGQGQRRQVSQVRHVPWPWHVSHVRQVAWQVWHVWQVFPWHVPQVARLWVLQKNGVASQTSRHVDPHLPHQVGDVSGTHWPRQVKSVAGQATQVSISVASTSARTSPTGRRGPSRTSRSNSSTCRAVRTRVYSMVAFRLSVTLVASRPMNGG